MNDSSNPQPGMEKRVLLTSVLCLLVFLLWQEFFLPKPVKPKHRVNQVAGKNLKAPGQAAPEKLENKVEPGVEVPGIKKNGKTLLPGVTETPEKKYPVKKFIFQNKFLKIELTSQGAGVNKVTLLDYWDTVQNSKKKDEDHYLVLLDTPDGTAPAGALSVDLDKAPDLEHNCWDVIVPDLKSRNSVTFKYVLGATTIEKEFSLPPEKRAVSLKVRIKGAPLSYSVAGPLGINKEKFGSSRGTSLQGHVAFFAEDGVVYADKFSIAGKKNNPAPVRGKIIWGSVSGKYFTSIICAKANDGIIPDFVSEGKIEIEPDPSLIKKALLIYAAKNNKKVKDLQPFEIKDAEKSVPRVGRPVLVAKGKSSDFSQGYELFFGAKDPKILRKYGGQLNFDKVINYGYFLAPEFLVKIFLVILKALKTVVFDYGLAIIALTFLVKLLLHPLNRKNQKSMQTYQAKIAKIQPELDGIKERYKNNRRKMHTEMQNLMKEKGVNPQQMLGGCLLMFLQLPVWVALISVFRQSIELRQQPGLFGLLSDLSQPDHAFSFGTSLPLVHWQYLNVLPILYVLTTLVYQRMMPKAKNDQAKQQQKMMGFMMVFFGFIFYNFASGLLLYFLTSSSLGIVEQRIIRHELKVEKDKEEEFPKTSKKSKTPEKKQKKKRPKINYNKKKRKQ